MTDDKKIEPAANVGNATAPEAPPSTRAGGSAPPIAPPTIWGAPLAAYVKGGTSTMANDRGIAEREADAEKRRDLAAMENRIASVPIEHGGGRIYANRLTENSAIPKAYIVLDYVNARGEPIHIRGAAMQCLADIITISATELALILVCPLCIKNRRPQGEAQIQIRQSNKRWELDPRQRGELVRFENALYPQAGRITECERFTCDRCGWAARIYDNKVRAE